MGVGTWSVSRWTPLQGGCTGVTGGSASALLFWRECRWVLGGCAALGLWVGPSLLAWGLAGPWARAAPAVSGLASGRSRWRGGACGVYLTILIMAQKLAVVMDIVRAVRVVTLSPAPRVKTAAVITMMQARMAMR